MDILRTKLWEMKREIFGISKLPFSRLKKFLTSLIISFPKIKKKKSMVIIIYYYPGDIISST